MHSAPDLPADRDVRQAALLVATVAAFVTPFLGASVVVALPAIGREHGADPVTLSWIATSFILAAAVFLVPFGRLADIYGRRRIFARGVELFTLGSLACAAAPSIGLLIAARALQGAGSTMIFGTGTAILTSVFPPSERGRVLGINVAAVYLGLSLGPPLGGVLTEQLGWRSIFVVSTLLGLALVALVRLKLTQEWADAIGDEYDLAGAVLYGAALAMTMVGIGRLPNPSGSALTAGGVAAFAAFAWREARARSPLLPLALFRRNTIFAFSNLAALINYSATFGSTFLLSLYLQYVRGLDAQTAGLVLLAQPVVMALLSPTAGRLSDRIQPRTVASAGMGVTSLALTLLAMVGARTPFGFLVANLALLGAGFALFSSPNTNAVMGSVERRSLGLASAVLGTMRLTGQVLSMAIAALLLSVHVGRQAITPAAHGAFLSAFRAGFLVFAVLCVVGVFASLARGKTAVATTPRQAHRPGD